MCMLAITLGACKKQDDWLDKKSNKADVIPVSLKDFQALLDNTSIMNTNYPSLGMMGTDNFYLSDEQAINGGQANERNAYKWAADIYEGSLTIGNADWANPYKIVAYANTVLEGLTKIEISDQNITEWNTVKGNALFFRGFAFFGLSQLYIKPYDKVTAQSDLGLPLKLSPDVNEKVARSSVKESYERLIADLMEAIDLLPNTPLYKTRPSKAACYALLAKVYLNMGDYPPALKFADEALKINSALLQFSSINSTPIYPFPTYQNNNAEITFYSNTFSYSSMGINFQFVSESLYSLYGTNDLRRNLFFRPNVDGTKSFRGRYTGAVTHFSGLATNEMYFIKSECLARTGRYSEAMDVLNKVLETRWSPGTYINYSANDETSALNIILQERNKEMPFTGNIRWDDLRRLNKDPRFAKSLIRTIAGQTYTLPPNDPRYVLPIVPSELLINDLPQNLR